MLKHVLMFRLKSVDGNKDKSSQVSKLKDLLEGLKEKIPEIRLLKTGINISPSPNRYDLIYESGFDDVDDLEKYRNHPDHLKIVQWIKENCSDRAVVDYWE